MLKNSLSCRYSPLYSSGQYCFFRHYMKRERCLVFSKEFSFRLPFTCLKSLFKLKNNKIYQFAFISFSGSFCFDYQFSIGNQKVGTLYIYMFTIYIYAKYIWYIYLFSWYKTKPNQYFNNTSSLHYVAGNEVHSASPLIYMALELQLRRFQTVKCIDT